ncbi:hypothetical protein IAJ44_004249 [Salmonella enterica]|nr:hypothetical protein [Salmonella enterica subsp. enterica serovar Mississippi]EGD6457189.1 hypothetical protein [Salmonella enterica]
MYLSTFAIVCIVFFFFWYDNRKNKEINRLTFEVESLTNQLETANENIESYHRMQDRAREGFYHLQDALLKATEQGADSEEMFDLYRLASKATDFFQDDRADPKNTPW